MENVNYSAITSRIYHDLASPMGAIANGLELLSLSLPSQPEELTLVQQSIDGASARLQLLRRAFGDGMNPIAARYLQEELSIGTPDRLTVVLDVQEDIAGREAKRLALAVLCCESVATRDARVEILFQDRWQLRLEGHGITAKNDKLDTLRSGQFTTPSPAQIHFAMLYQELQPQTLGISALDQGVLVTL